MMNRRKRAAHPLPIRIMHWIGAASILCMMLSGWAIGHQHESEAVNK